jgi:hypothetical protein
MKRYLAVLVVLAALVSPVHAQQDPTTYLPLLSDYDLDATDPTYCVTTGVGGFASGKARPGFGKIKTDNGGLATDTLVSFTTGSGAFTGVSVGDELIINGGRTSAAGSDVVLAYVSSVTDENEVVIGPSDLLLEDANGHAYQWRKRACGTGATAGAFQTKGWSAMTVQYGISQINSTTGITVYIECRAYGTHALWVQQHSATRTAVGEWQHVISAPQDECRVGFEHASTDDGGDLTTNMEKVSAYVTGWR